MICFFPQQYETGMWLQRLPHARVSETSTILLVSDFKSNMINKLCLAIKKLYLSEEILAGSVRGAGS